MKRISILFMLVIFVASCSTSMPQWYTQRESSLPESDYLVAKGWGETPDKAIEDAIIELSRIFGNKISVEKTVLERYESVWNEGDTQESYNEFSSEFAKFITEQNLVNVQYMDPIKEKKRSLYVTIAYLDRDKTADILINRMERIQEQVDFYVNEAAKGTDVVDKYRYLNAAWLSCAKATMMQEQLDVLEPGISMGMTYGYVQLAKMKNEAAEGISFSIYSNAKSDPNIEQAISKVINENGFKVQFGHALMKINYSTSYKKIDIHQDMLVFVAWDFNVKLHDNKGRTLLSVYEQGREGSLNISNAKMHAVEHIQDYIDEEFGNKLTDFFDQTGSGQ